MDLNHAVLIGRLAKNAELKSAPNGLAVCKFTLAVNRRKKNGDRWEDEANFFDVTLFGKQAESLEQYLLKGRMIAVEGELRQERWTQDGQNRSKVTVHANKIQLLGGDSRQEQGRPENSGLATPGW